MITSKAGRRKETRTGLIPKASRKRLAVLLFELLQDKQDIKNHNNLMIYKSLQ
jgi:hypothetical protein